MSSDDAQQSSGEKIRRVYGRGFQDGMRAIRETMTTATKLAAAERGLTSEARKVFNVVPIAAAWKPNQILGELKREGINMPMNIVMGCLRALVDDGMVRQTGDSFLRVTPSERPPKLTLSAVQQPTPEPTPEPATKDTLTKLADLSAVLKKRSNDLLALAKEIDDIAIEVEERIARADTDGAKPRQLQELLRGIA
jgi:hypothetical protein